MDPWYMLLACTFAAFGYLFYLEKKYPFKRPKRATHWGRFRVVWRARTRV